MKIHQPWLTFSGGGQKVLEPSVHGWITADAIHMIVPVHLLHKRGALALSVHRNNRERWEVGNEVSEDERKSTVDWDVYEKGLNLKILVTHMRI